LPGERSEGDLREGYAADITVVSGDPFDDVDARAVMTIVGGEVVHTTL
jgi:predicted amidohydrolase YtcJ